MRPLRVLFVNEGIGGHNTVHATLRAAFARRADVVAEFLDVPDPGPLGRFLRLPVPGLARLDADVQVLRAQLVRSAWLRSRLSARLAPGHPDGPVDAVHVYTQAVALWSARELAGVPTVVSTDSTALLNSTRIPYRSPGPGTPLAARLGSAAEAPVLRAATRVVATSTWVAGALRDCGVPDERLVVLPFGIALPPSPAPRPVRPGRRPVIAWTGYHLERKGGTQLLRVHAEHLRDSADLLLITPRAVRPAPGVTVVSDLRGGDPRLWSLLGQADVFAFPSTMDQSPNAVLEAQAAGLPVVAHPVAAVPELVRDGVTGFLVPPRDDAALVTALRRLVDDDDLRATMSRAARAHVEASYDGDATAEALLAVLHDAVAAHRAPCRTTRRAGDRAAA